MTPHSRAAILDHVQRELPREACGLLVNVRGHERYRACRNLAGGDDHFVLDPEDWAAAEDAGEVVAVVHSHPNGSANASEADRTACEATGLPWHIVAWPSGVWTHLEPTGWRAPLLGRTFSHGVLDCYTLVRDYYGERLGITLPDFVRTDGWWDRGEDLYRRNAEAAGFYVAAEPALHDMVVMRIADGDPQHAGVIVEGGEILHHLPGRLSCREPYGEFWRSRTVVILRHRECCAP